ncbi:MAG: hypothetical protein WD749_01660, partial [Phycisphaerales bacterium]
AVFDDLRDAPAALGRALSLDRGRCRGWFEARFSARRMAEDYLRVYRRVAGARGAWAGRAGARGAPANGRSAPARGAPHDVAGGPGRGRVGTRGGVGGWHCCAEDGEQWHPSREQRHLRGGQHGASDGRDRLD